jgi:hypothetical protein
VRPDSHDIIVEIALTSVGHIVWTDEDVSVQMGMSLTLQNKNVYKEY